MNMTDISLFIKNYCIMLAPLSTAVQYLMIPREEAELNDVKSYNIFDTKIYKILS